MRASKILQQRLFANPKIEVIWNTVVEEVLGGRAGAVNGSCCATSRRTRRATLDATGLFVFIGFRPNTGIIDGHFDHDDMGYLRHRREHADVASAGLFAAGDVRSQLTRQVTTAVGDATTAAIAVEKYLKARTEGGHAVDPIGSGGYAV